ncbi:uncharacterized protein LOC123700204 isoform X1 [Colias croceus]|uniref:uncharacterized protein LOC123700204 isoform X1 n=1 Tax=Colias crocea TaxID=72248 RepID=UPI001E27C806|nr:uncharacterized protein LOC123700204 isoform X1 [Colias croceus]
MRVLSLAPLTIARERAGYRIRVCKRYAYAGYLYAIFLNVFHVYISSLGKDSKNEYIKTIENLPLLWLLTILDVSLGTIITGLGALFSISRMNNVIEQVYYMEQVFPAHRQKEVNNKNKRLILFMIISRMLLDGHFLVYTAFINKIDKGWVGLLSNRLKFTVVCSVQAYVFALYEEMLSKIRIVREELQDLADLLEFEYIPSSAAFTESVNLRLRKIVEKIDFLKKIFGKMNQSNQYTAFFIYINIITRLIETAFDLLKFGPEGLTVMITFRFLFLLHHYFVLVMFTEPFHGIEIEIQALKLQASRIATTDYVTDSIPAPLEMLYDELSTMNMTFSPLGIITIDRSLLAKTLGAAISYLVIVLQFKVDSGKN